MIGENQIKDMSALVENCKSGGLKEGPVISLSGNQLSSKAINEDIPFLESQGVEVYFTH